MSDDLAVAGQPHAITYRLRVNGVLTDLPAGGSVDQVRILDGIAEVLLITGPATRVSVGTYEFPAATMPAAGDYTTEVTYRTAADGPDRLDSNDTLRVYEFTGVVDGPAGTDLELIRLLISDLADPPMFSDLELQSFLTLEGAVRLAAACALDVIASNEALVSKRIRTLDLQTDGPAVAKALRDHAALLREQYYFTLDGADGGGYETTTLLGRPSFRRHWSPELTEG